MKLKQISWIKVAERAEKFNFNDKYGRQIGARYSIFAVVYEQAPEDAKSWTEPPDAVTGPGEYFQVMTHNTRNGDDKQKIGGIVAASLQAAGRYAEAYIAKRAKDAAKVGEPR